MKIKKLIVLVLMLNSPILYSQDMGKQIFNQSETYHQFLQNGVNKNVVEDMIKQQDHFVGNFCAMCGCCQEKNIDWATVDTNLVQELERAKISFVPSEQAKLLLEALERSDTGVVSNLDDVSGLLATKIEFCNKCNCCGPKFGFSPIKAKDSNFVSIPKDANNAGIGNNAAEIYILPKWLLSDSLGKLIE